MKRFKPGDLAIINHDNATHLKKVFAIIEIIDYSALFDGNSCIRGKFLLLINNDPTIHFTIDLNNTTEWSISYLVPCPEEYKNIDWKNKDINFSSILGI